MKIGITNPVLKVHSQVHKHPPSTAAIKCSRCASILQLSVGNIDNIIWASCRNCTEGVENVLSRSAETEKRMLQMAFELKTLKENIRNLLS